MLCSQRILCGVKARSLSLTKAESKSEEEEEVYQPLRRSSVVPDQSSSDNSDKNGGRCLRRTQSMIAGSRTRPRPNPNHRCNSSLSNKIYSDVNSTDVSRVGSNGSSASSIYDSVYDFRLRHFRNPSIESEPIYGNSDVIATSFETAVPSTYYHINTLKRVDTATANNKLSRTMSFSEPQATSTPNNMKFPWDYVRRSARNKPGQRRGENSKVRRSCSFSSASPTVTPISRVYVASIPPPPCPHKAPTCQQQQLPRVQHVPMRNIENLAPGERDSVLQSIYASQRQRPRPVCQHVRRSQSFSNPPPMQQRLPQPVLLTINQTVQPKSNLKRSDSSTSTLSHTSFVTVYEKETVPGTPDRGRDDSGCVSDATESKCSSPRSVRRITTKAKRPATIAGIPVGLDNVCSKNIGLRSGSDLNPPRTDTYRLSMANLEDTQDVDLDAILGELCALESQYDKELSQTSLNKTGTTDLSQHRRSPSETHGVVARTDSPDNDSAFSDSVSLLSSESSASSGRTDATASSSVSANQGGQNGKTEKIRLALQKMREANIKKIFIKVFSLDGSAKSLLVDESMTCGYVTRLLAEKNHTSLEPSWGLVEYVNDLHMERVYEDHEMLVSNLMLWTRDSQNKLYFVERPERTLLFERPELFHNDHLTTPLPLEPLDEFTKNSIIEELLSGAGGPNMEGPLYIKTESRKGWKKYQSVLRASGLYYLPKDKSSSRSPKDLICLTKFENNQVYYGVGWKKKLKAPTEFGFAVKHPCLQQPKSSKHIKYLCAEDSVTMHKWVIAIRIVKYGRQLYENYRSILEGDEVDNEILDQSDSGSSGCDVAFESDFPSGTIKRKPVKIPLTQTTRQLKDIASSNSNMLMLRRDDEIVYGNPVLDRNSVAIYGNVERRIAEEPLDVNHCNERHIKLDIPNSPKERLSSLSSSSSIERNNIYGNASTLKRQSSLDKKVLIGTDRLVSEILPLKHQNSLDKNSHRLGSGEGYYETATLTRQNSGHQNDSKPSIFLERTDIDETMIERSPSFSSLPPPPPELLASTLTLNEDVEEIDLPPPPPPRLLPPTEDFLQDLQRVMRRKWQVAQKCKLDLKMTPHEVLGFRDGPPGEKDYREANVSNWVQEHYGCTTISSNQYNLYENIYAKSHPTKSTILSTNSSTTNTHKPKTVTFNLPPSPVVIPDTVPILKKRPPPPPPRAETTQLTTKILPPKQPC